MKVQLGFLFGILFLAQDLSLAKSGLEDIVGVDSSKSQDSSSNLKWKKFSRMKNGIGQLVEIQHGEDREILYRISNKSRDTVCNYEIKGVARMVPLRKNEFRRSLGANYEKEMHAWQGLKGDCVVRIRMNKFLLEFETVNCVSPITCPSGSLKELKVESK